MLLNLPLHVSLPPAFCSFPPKLWGGKTQREAPRPGGFHMAPESVTDSGLNQ